ncbi:MAG TPA: hypothetical protein VMS08_04815, partial [Candidatus Saccharimonadia bacterium]|nr:hypothetical protein [Candidatus Saccharimonadia bacterium]
LVHVKDLDVSPDQCMSGADSHHWHLYQARVLGRPEVKINYEGGGAVWADLTKAKKLDLAPAIRTILDRVSFS